MINIFFLQNYNYRLIKIFIIGFQKRRKEGCIEFYDDTTTKKYEKGKELHTRFNSFVFKKISFVENEFTFFFSKQKR